MCDECVCGGDSKPVDEKPEAEIRGGNRPSDYLPVAHEDFELEDGAPSYGEEDDGTYDDLDD